MRQGSLQLVDCQKLWGLCQDERLVLINANLTRTYVNSKPPANQQVIRLGEETRLPMDESHCAGLTGLDTRWKQFLTMADV